jgi:DNA repair exonuclease SbcCD ATPase subunit
VRQVLHAAESTREAVLVEVAAIRESLAARDVEIEALKVAAADGASVSAAEAAELAERAREADVLRAALAEREAELEAARLSLDSTEAMLREATELGAASATDAELALLRDEVAASARALSEATGRSSALELALEQAREELERAGGDGENLAMLRSELAEAREALERLESAEREASAARTEELESLRLELSATKLALENYEMDQDATVMAGMAITLPPEPATPSPFDPEALVEDLDQAYTRLQALRAEVERGGRRQTGEWPQVAPAVLATAPALEGLVDRLRALVQTIEGQRRELAADQARWATARAKLAGRLKRLQANPYAEREVPEIGQFVNELDGFLQTADGIVQRGPSFLLQQRAVLERVIQDTGPHEPA